MVVLDGSYTSLCVDTATHVNNKDRSLSIVGGSLDAVTSSPNELGSIVGLVVVFVAVVRSVNQTLPLADFLGAVNISLGWHFVTVGGFQ